jgi:7-cyano-7-deazaguanine synthase
VPKAVVLLSGGLDSYTAAAIVSRQGFDLYALTVRYGQRHERELEAARRVATNLGAIEHREIAVDLRAFGGSALTTGIPVPKDRAVAVRTTEASSPAEARGATAFDFRSGRAERSRGTAADLPTASGPRTPDIPITYVPARNTVFLSLALAWAEVLGAADIVIGANAVDYSGYPDCRPEFLDAFEHLAAVATKAGVEGRTFSIHAPLLRLSKGQIIRRGLELGLDYGLTHSCYDPGAGGEPCGRCDSCQLRARGFQEAGVADPLLVR